jgi:hypothetical protein
MTTLILILGARGSGKSTKAREVTGKSFRRVTIDPSGDWQRRGVKPVRDLPELSKLIAAKWRSGFDVVLTPPPGKEAIALHHVSDMLFHFQAQVYRGKPSQEVMLVVDEMAEAYSNADAQRANLSGFRRTILQGRHYGISVCGITQRPQDVATRYRDNCDKIFAFSLYADAGRDAVVAMMGRAHAASYDGLKKYEFLEKDGATGAVRKGKTRPG